MRLLGEPGSPGPFLARSVAVRMRHTSKVSCNASKHAVIGLTKTAALEVAPTGVRVNAVLPGNIPTRMGLSSDARADDAENERRAARLVPQGRIGTPEEIADAVCFLASDAATHITGIELPVDGGILASSYGTAFAS